MTDHMYKIPRDISELYTGKTILIVGAAGYIGSSLAKAMADIDCHLVLLDCDSDTDWLPVHNRARITSVQGDICEPLTWLNIIPDVDYVFHLAAAEYNRTHYCVSRDWRINACSVLNLLDACRKESQAPRIIFSSSANLFGCVDILPVNESTPDNPPSLWSVHKQLAETYFDLYRQNYGIENVTLRLSNVYGPSVRNKSEQNVIINRVVKQALTAKSITTYANKECIRDYIFIDDVVMAFMQAGAIKIDLSHGPECYVIGSEESITIAKAWQIIAEQTTVKTARQVCVRFDGQVELEPLDFRNFVADTTCFRNVTSWETATSFVEGIKITVEAFCRAEYEDAI